VGNKWWVVRVRVAKKTDFRKFDRPPRHVGSLCSEKNDEKFQLNSVLFRGRSTGIKFILVYDRRNPLQIEKKKTIFASIYMLTSYLIDVFQMSF